MDNDIENEVKQALGETEPSLEEIIYRECDCRCGVEGCEFAADFSDIPTPRPEDYGEETVAADDAEEYTGTGVEVRSQIDGYNEYLIPSAPDFYGAPTPGLFPFPLVPPAPEFTEDPMTENGEDIYHDTADYTMISTNPETFDAQGS